MFLKYLILVGMFGTSNKAKMLIMLLLGTDIDHLAKMKIGLLLIQILLEK
jgi:hypothetical protein